MAAADRGFEGQRLGRCLEHLDAGIAGTGSLDEWCRRIDGHDRFGTEAGYELGGEGTGTATDIEDALTVADPGKVGEPWREEARVSAHEAVVRVRRHVEAHPPKFTASAGTVGPELRPARETATQRRGGQQLG